METAWLGGPLPQGSFPPELWADVSTRHFTDREPEHAFVVERVADGAVRGMLMGTVDARRLEASWLGLVPRLLAKAVLRGALGTAARRRQSLDLLLALARQELFVPRKVREEFPARLFFTLAEDARGYGLGPMMFEPFLDALSLRHVPGVHLQIVSANAAALQFVRRVGFRLAASWPLTLFAHLDVEPVELSTWVLPIGRAAHLER